MRSFEKILPDFIDEYLDVLAVHPEELATIHRRQIDNENVLEAVGKGELSVIDIDLDALLLERSALTKCAIETELEIPHLQTI